ncbi:MAG: FAD binding domain-containing protein [Fusobacteriaceae bacterium]
MLNFKNYFLADSVSLAYEELMKNKKNVIIGGGSYLRLGNSELNTVISLDKLEMEFIKEDSDYITLGPMVNFRELETNDIIKKYCNGIISESVSGILGVQFRNNATLGATVFSKYGFSDLITALLAVDAKVVLFKQGELTLKEYLAVEQTEKDILVEVKLPKNSQYGVFKCVRKSSTDYSIVNVGVVKDKNNNYTVTVGARPSRAKIAENFSKEITSIIKNIENKNIELLEEKLTKELLGIIDEELIFGDNMRGSGKYRCLLSKNLIKMAVMEVFTK